MRKLASIVLVTALVSLSYGQSESCEQARAFLTSFDGQCINQIKANNCVNLDVTDSYDFEGKEFEFIWNMGDGVKKEGLNINHCYQNPGRYIAKLSLRDPITKVILDEEASINIVIKGSFSLSLDSLADVRAQRPEAHTYTMDFPDSAYQIKGTYWDFGDETFSCENTPEYTYENAGKYFRTLVIELTSAIDTVVLCALDSIEAKIHDPSEGLLDSALSILPIESRFLMERVNYLVLRKQGDTYQEITSYADLQGGFAYRIVAHRGSYIFDSGDILTEASTSGKEVQNKIGDAARALSSSEPRSFESTYFELDQEELSRKNKQALKANMELAEEIPMIQIAIGVYTSSKGSIDKAAKLSMERAQLLKAYLVENGVAEERIICYNPDTFRTLINSCLTGSDCEEVDPSLDRRADFKIIGLK